MNKNIKPILGVLFGSALLSFVGLVADLITISTSEIVKYIVESNLVKYFPYALILAMSLGLLYFYKLLISKEHEVKKCVKQNHTLLKRTVRTLRSIFVDDLPTPTIGDAFAPLLDELVKNLPDRRGVDGGGDFKISVAAPLMDGSFKILASRGTDPASVHLLESRSNWQSKRSFFSEALLLDEDLPYKAFTSGEVNYVNIQKSTGIGTAKQHFTVVIKNNRYNEKLHPHNSLAVVSIGFPPKIYIGPDEEKNIYDRIYPTLQMMEVILLLQSKVEFKK